MKDFAVSFCLQLSLFRVHLLSKLVPFPATRRETYFVASFLLFEYLQLLLLSRKVRPLLNYSSIYDILHDRHLPGPTVNNTVLVIS